MLSAFGTLPRDSFGHKSLIAILWCAKMVPFCVLGMGALAPPEAIVAIQRPKSAALIVVYSWTWRRRQKNNEIEKGEEHLMEGTLH